MVEEELGLQEADLRGLRSVLDRGVGEEEGTHFSQEISGLEAGVEALKKRFSELLNEKAAVEEESSSLSEQFDELKLSYAKASVERDKIYLEVFKLVATLDTALLIGATAIVVGLLPEQVQSLWILTTAYVLILLSTYSCVAVCLSLAVEMTENLSPEPKPSSRSSRLYTMLNLSLWAGALLGFAAGVILLMSFFSNNLSNIETTPETTPDPAPSRSAPGEVTDSS